MELARTLAKKLKRGSVLALTGNLGSGKTTFVKGLATGLRLKQRIQSPTFVIFRKYRLAGRPIGNFYHFDFYRLKTRAEIDDLGFAEILAHPNNIIVIEWPKLILRLLPPKTKFIHFHYGKTPSQRIITDR